jgi:hypothetical protein
MLKPLGFFIRLLLNLKANTAAHGMESHLQYGSCSAWGNISKIAECCARKEDPSCNHYQTVCTGLNRKDDRWVIECQPFCDQKDYAWCKERSGVFTGFDKSVRAMNTLVPFAITLLFVVPGLIGVIICSCLCRRRGEKVQESEDRNVLVPASESLNPTFLEQEACDPFAVVPFPCLED